MKCSHHGLIKGSRKCVARLLRTPAASYLCQDVNAVLPGFWQREMLRVRRRCRQSTDMQGGTDPRHKNCPQTAHDKGEQPVYSKYGIVVTDVNDIGSTQSLQPESVNVKVQLKSNTAKRSRCLWCRAHSAIQQLAQRYHRLFALYRQGDLVRRLFPPRLRGFGRPTCACCCLPCFLVAHTAPSSFVAFLH